VGEERTSAGVRSRLVAALFPLGEALAAERALRARRPEVADERPAVRAAEVEHWRAQLDGSPTLGTLVDAIHDDERTRAATVVGAAHTVLASTVTFAGLLVIAIALPAIGQMFDVSLWLVVAAGYAWLAVFAAVRATRLGRFVRLGLDALTEPIERAQQAHREQWGSVLLVEARARRAAASAHDRALSEGIEAFVAAASASLRNAFVVLAIWLALNAVPQAIAAAWRGLVRSIGG
jgi:hypothetical protein